MQLQEGKGREVRTYRLCCFTVEESEPWGVLKCADGPMARVRYRAIGVHEFEHLGLVWSVPFLGCHVPN